MISQFQFKFIVNNEYILCPTGGPKEYDTVTTAEGFANNVVDPMAEFYFFDPATYEEKEEKHEERVKETTE